MCIPWHFHLLCFLFILSTIKNNSASHCDIHTNQKPSHEDDEGSERWSNKEVIKKLAWICEKKTEKEKDSSSQNHNKNSNDCD